MKLASTGWMRRIEKNVVFCGSSYKLEVRYWQRYVCAQQLREILGVSLNHKDQEIRVTMYSHYVEGSNEVEVRRSERGGYLFYRGPRARVPYIHGGISNLLNQNKTFCNWMMGKTAQSGRHTIYLLTETREVG